MQEIDGARFVVAGLNTVLQIGRCAPQNPLQFLYLSSKKQPQKFLNFPVQGYLAIASCRYVDEHEKLFGTYTYGLPPQPPAAKLAELDVTFQEWLDGKGLYALMPFFVYSQAAQGYGSLEKVPALYGARCFTRNCSFCHPRNSPEKSE